MRHIFPFNAPQGGLYDFGTWGIVRLSGDYFGVQSMNCKFSRASVCYAVSVFECLGSGIGPLQSIN